MPKISVVMPVYNASRFLKDSVNSILNQTLDDFELICVDDGSTDDSLTILNSFNDQRIKIYSLNHKGSGNARNYGLSKINGKYLFFMDADDILDLNAFEDFFRISEEKNLDFLVFKAINYGVEKEHYFETEYQNMAPIYNKVKDNIFSYRDLGDLIFEFNVSPWCKFYNSKFINKTEAKFEENLKFDDNLFFWDILFKAERIYFINDFYYTRKRHTQSLTSSGDIRHLDIIEAVNNIIKLFIKHNQLDNYKHKLYNLKITWITDRYNQTHEEFKEEFFNKMKTDYISLKTSEYPNLLDENKKFIYDCAIISKNHNDFDLIKKYYSLTESKLSDFDEKYLKNKKTIDELNNKLKNNEKIIKNQNNKIKENYTTITNLNSKLDDNKKTIEKQNNILNDNKKTIRELSDTIKNNENRINELNNQIINKNKIIKQNTLKISQLETKNMNLNKKNDYLQNELNNRFLFKLLKKK